MILLSQCQPLALGLENNPTFHFQDLWVKLKPEPQLGTLENTNTAELKAHMHLNPRYHWSELLNVAEQSPGYLSEAQAARMRFCVETGLIEI